MIVTNTWRLLDAINNIQEATTQDEAVAAYFAARPLFRDSDNHQLVGEVIDAFRAWMDAHPTPITPLVVFA